MNSLAANKGSKIIKLIGILAVIGLMIVVARLIFKGIRSAKSEPEPEDEHSGV